MGNSLGTKDQQQSNILMFGCNDSFQEIKNKFSNTKSQTIGYQEQIIQNARFICLYMIEQKDLKSKFVNELKLLKNKQNQSVLLEIWKNKSMQIPESFNFDEIPLFFKQYEKS
jgi:hypothetical protein